MKPSVVCCFASFTLATPLPPPLQAQLLSHTTDAIPGRYIVKLKTGVSALNLPDVLKLTSHEPGHIYIKGGLIGFAAELDDEEVTSLYNHPDVEAVEIDTRVTSTGYVEQHDAPWGLARISHREKGTNTYIYDDSAGEGTCAYVLDTGIYTDHDEFEGRAEMVANFVKKEDEDDLSGHGTHCAATLAGKTYGVAKKAKIFGVKVMNKRGSGDKSDILAGLDFILEDSRNRTQECPKGFILSISLGTPFSTVLNEAVKTLIDAGIFVAVAAGNKKADTGKTSPASEETVCTVAALDEGDDQASFSNFGPVIDIYAPGVNILSAWIGEETSTHLLNGTSMAAPHVAGLAAYLLALNKPMRPQELCTYMAAIATSGQLSNPGVQTPNLIAFNGNSAGGSRTSSERIVLPMEV